MQEMLAILSTNNGSERVINKKSVRAPARAAAGSSCSRSVNLGTATPPAWHVARLDTSGCQSKTLKMHPYLEL